MSETQDADADKDGAAPPPDPPHDEVDIVARKNGWKPLAEFTGPPEKWVPAEVYVARGLDNPAILAERNKMLADKLDRLERVHGATLARVDETAGMLEHLTKMTRGTEERSYARARRELIEERDKAVEAGDTAAFRQVDQQLTDLQAAAPPPPPEPAKEKPAALPPEVQQFYEDNPWYLANRTMMAEADLIHVGLNATRPDLTRVQNLMEVQRRMRAQFPVETGVRAAAAPPAEDNSRRAEPAAVAASSASASRAPVNRQSFDAMPKDSKDAYLKYVKILDGKGAPLTKEEWAGTYWGQFVDDGRG